MTAVNTKLGLTLGKLSWLRHLVVLSESTDLSTYLHQRGVDTVIIQLSCLPRSEATDRSGAA
jgi:hypothetical protein